MRTGNPVNGALGDVKIAGWREPTVNRHGRPDRRGDVQRLFEWADGDGEKLAGADGAGEESV